MTTRTIALNFLLLAAAIFTFISCVFEPGVEGNGNITIETRELKSFDQIEVSGGFTVILSQGTAARLEVEADENLIDLISTNVKGGVLSVRSKESIRGSRNIKILIEVQDLTKISLSGAVDLSTTAEFTTAHLKIDGSGASTLNMVLNVGSLEAELSGANNVTLNGKAESFYAKLTGASDLKAFGFEVNEMEIKVSGAGDARVSVRDKLKVNISGAGSVTYRGDPTIEQSISGAGSLRKN